MAAGSVPTKTMTMIDKSKRVHPRLKRLELDEVVIVLFIGSTPRRHPRSYSTTWASMSARTCTRLPSDVDERGGVRDMYRMTTPLKMCR
jgi:hypothetical protein